MRVRKAVTSAVLALAMTAGVTVNPAAAQEREPTSSITYAAAVDGARASDGIEVDESAGIVTDVLLDVAADGEHTSTTVVDDPASVEGDVVVTFDPDAGAEDVLEVEAVEIDAVVEGEQVVETLAVEDFVLLGESDFTATLRVQSTGEVLHIDTTVVEAQALPALFVLGVLARLGIKHVITWYGRTQIKHAVKSYLLNSLSASKWSHIMAAKHNWHLLGARSREQVADLMGSAMANGSHSSYGSAMKAVWRHNGRTITVTYDKASGKVSNGWVN